MTRGISVFISGILLVLVSSAASFGLSFSTPTVDIGTATTTVAIYMADLDGDGDLDMVNTVGTWGSYSGKIWNNDGTGSFSDSGNAIGSPTTTYAGAVGVADLDNDGDLDIVHANQEMYDNRIFTNDGSGTFTDSGQSLGTNDTLSLALADVNGDGYIDIIEGVGPYTANSDIIWLNDGSATFSDTGQALGNSDSNSVFAADVDADGDVDFIVGASYSDNRIMTNDGSGTFADSGQAIGGSTALTNSIFAADLDADGDIDFIEGVAGTSRVWGNDGTGSFSEITQSLATGTTESVFAADLDIDGDIDFVMGNYDEENYVYLNDGAGVFSDSGLSLGASNTVSIFVGDMDGDNLPDIMEGNLNGGNRLWVNSTAVTNTMPTAPTLTAEADMYSAVATPTVTLNWTAGSDSDTSDADMLTYDIRIGTTSAGCEIYCGFFPSVGSSPLRSPMAGNTGPSTTSFSIPLPATATYFWSARTVDPSYYASSWDTEDSFTITFDNTEPSTPATIYDSLGGDLTYSSSTTKISANWTASTDAESGVTGYYIGIGSYPGTVDMLGYTDVGNVTATTVTGLTLSDGSTYYVRVMAENGAGLESFATETNGLTIDITAPSTISIVNDGADTDMAYSSSTTQLLANWSASTDVQSGVIGYWVGFGTTAGATDVADFTSVGSSTSASRTGLTLSDGVTYYASVIAKNGAYISSAAAISNGMMIDSTAPVATGTVMDLATITASIDIDYASSTADLTAGWSDFTDTESGVAYYLVAVGTSPGATDTFDWSAMNQATAAYLNDVSLVDGETYYVSVMAMNNAGGYSSVLTSDGITLDTTGPSDPASVNDGPGSDLVYASSTTFLAANWTASTDAQSGIMAYLVAIGTTAGSSDVAGWKNVGNVTSATISGLTLTNGVTYFVSVRGVNNAGILSQPVTSNGQTIDNTSPTDITTVNDGTGTDEDYSNSSTQLSANWTASADAESGLSAYWVAVGTTAGATNTMNWTSYATGSTTATITGLTLANGSTYYVSVKAENGGGGMSNVTSSDGITVDTTAPSAISKVNDGSVTNTDAAYSSSTSQLSANWSASTDSESGIAAYYVAIGQTAGATDTLDWASNGVLTATTVVNLTLSSGKTYYFSVKACNNAGLCNTPTNSNGQTIDTSAPSSISAVYDGDQTEVDMDGWSKTDTLTFSWASSKDTQSGIAKYWVSIGTTSGGSDFLDWTSAGVVNTYTYAATYTEAVKYYVSVKAENGAGLQSAVKISDGITIATTDPTSTIKSPVDGSYLQSLDSITGTAADGAGFELDKVEITIMKDDSTYWNGVAWVSTETWLKAEGTTNWSYSDSYLVWVTNTTYTIISRATDKIYNVETPGSGVSFTYDVTRPTVEILFPTDTYETNASSVLVYGNAEYGSTVVATISSTDYTATLTGGSAETMASFTVTVPISEGDNTIDVLCTDTAGNERSDSVTFSMDATSPTASISEPTTGASLTGEIKIKGTVTDTHFDYYTLSYGPGSSPSTWVTFETGGFSSTGGTIGTFDASKLSGTYSVKLMVFDTHGNSSSDSVTFTVSNTLSGKLYASANTWIMSSMPMEPDSDTLTTLLSNPAFTVYWWDPDREYDDDYGQYTTPSTLSAGQGFWILPNNSAEETIIITGSAVNSTTYFEYELGSGWNQIGTPFNWAFTWADVMVEYSQETYDLESAVSYGIIESTPFYYSGDGWRQLTEMASTKMQVGTGYFFYSNYDSVTLKYDPGSESGSGIAKVISKAPSTTMKFKVSATTNSAQDLDNVITLSTNAEDDRDGMDLREPPAGIGKYISLYFPHDEWEGDSAGRYTNDSRKSWGVDPGCDVPDGTKLCKEIEFSVETNDTTSAARLTWDDLSSYADGYTITLTDKTTGKTVDMASSAAYSYDAGSDEGSIRDFVITIIKELLEEITVTRSLDAGWNLVSIPLIPEITDALSVLGDDMDPYSVFQFYSDRFNTEKDDEGVDIQPGVGYWVFVQGETPIDITGVPTDSGVPMDIPVTAGWNLVGNPFSEDITWGNNIKVNCGGDSVDLEQAIDDGLVQDKIFTYDGSDYTSVQFGENLKAWKGYFLKASQDCELEMKK